MRGREKEQDEEKIRAFPLNQSSGSSRQPQNHPGVLHTAELDDVASGLSQHPYIRPGVKHILVEETLLVMENVDVGSTPVAVGAGVSVSVIALVAVTIADVCVGVAVAVGSLHPHQPGF